MIRCVLPIAAVMLTLVTMLTTGPSYGAVYKCLSASGETSYSQSPCPEDAASSKITKIKSSRGFTNNSGGNDCGLAQRFAHHTANDMRNGTSSSRAFNNYGGLSSMSGAAVSIANYVYTFEQNYETTAERIAGLVKSRCENGSFGKTSCEHFPSGFVSANGGCDLSKVRTGSREPEVGFAHSAPATAPVDQQGASQEQYVAEQAKADCKHKILRELEAIDNDARAGLTATQQDSYQTERQDLRNRFNQC